MTQPPPDYTDLTQQQQTVAERLAGQKKVRALAYAGSFGTRQAWAGSRPQVLAWQRGLEDKETRQEGEVQLTLLPFAPLEHWRGWAGQDREPLGLLATCRPQYDPTGQLGRAQRSLLTLSEKQRREWQQLLLGQAKAQLKGLHTDFQRSAGPHMQLRVLGEVRQIATRQLLPVFLSQRGIWVSETRLQASARLPHLWRTWLELPRPEVAWTLGRLYGFGGRNEAENVLQAARGLGLEGAAQQARTAVHSGYFDGAVRLMRDATFAAHQGGLGDWAHYSARKQGKLGTLLGAERTPIGAGALAVAEELLALARSQ